MEKITLDLLKRKFPRTAFSMTGYIPMDYFNANEREIRAVMRAAGSMRVWYRGPRVSNKSTATLRSRATHAVIYRV